MSVTITSDGDSDLLPITPDFLLQDATNWQTSVVGQLWRMFNERLLVNGKLMTWTSSGVVEYSIDKILPLEPITIGSSGGWKVKSSDNSWPSYSILFDDTAVIQAGANIQDIRTWRYMQEWIEKRAFMWRNPNSDYAFDLLTLRAAAKLPNGFRRYKHDGTLDYGVIQPGDLLGGWLVEDIFKFLSFYRIPYKPMYQYYSDDFNSCSFDNLITVLYFGWSRFDASVDRAGDISVERCSDSGVISVVQFMRFSPEKITPEDSAQYYFKPYLPYLMISSKTIYKLITEKRARYQCIDFSLITVDPITNAILPGEEFTGVKYCEYARLEKHIISLTSPASPFVFGDLVYPVHPIPVIFPTVILDPEHFPLDPFSWTECLTMLMDVVILPQFSVKGSLGNIEATRTG